MEYKETHEIYHIISADILKDAKDVRRGVRKVWITYSKESTGTPTYTKIFKLTQPQIIPHETAATYQFKEAVLFDGKPVGFTTSGKPLIDMKVIKSVTAKKKLEATYFADHIPEKIFLPKNFPHRNEKK